MSSLAIAVLATAPIAEAPGDAITTELVRENDRMLTGGFYAEVELAYSAFSSDGTSRPFAVVNLRPIQLSTRHALDDLALGRRKLTTQQWADLLLRSVGLEALNLTERHRDVLLLRMPFVQRNLNMVEIGPRGTGKSHIFQQISPYAHLVSGGKATVARMFIDNRSGQRGLVCQ